MEQSSTQLILRTQKGHCRNSDPSVKEVISGELRGAKADESFADERHNGVLDWNHAVDNATVNTDGHP